MISKMLNFFNQPQIFVLAVFVVIIHLTESTNQEPVNVGFIFSLPWDISNTLRAPLAGPLSIVLASGLALICFAGLVFAPVWYLFGFPPRNYYLHDIPEKRSFSSPYQDFASGNPYPLFQFQGNYSSISSSLGSLKNYRNFSESNTETDKFKYPDFVESLFLFVPDSQFEEDCRKLLVCHVHGFLGFLPDIWIKIYHFFSKKLLNVSPDYKNAILRGLVDQGSCMNLYASCTQDIVTLAKTTLFYNIPRDIRERWQIQIQP